MKNEYEIISNSQFEHLNVFIVRLFSRTPHLHRELELGIILDGSLTLKSSRQSWFLEKDSVYIINSMDVHEFITDEHGVLILAIQVSPKLFKPFLQNADRIRFSNSVVMQEIIGNSEHYTITKLCHQLALHYHKHDYCYESHCFALITEIFYRLMCRLPHETLSNQDYLPLTRRTDRMVNIIDYIDQNFQQKLLLEEIAERQGLTMPHLSHMFKETLGMSFQEYLKAKRFEYAFPLICETNRTILDISIESGFSDVRYLISAFQKELGCTPKEYRRQQQKKSRSIRSTTENLQYFLSSKDIVELLEST